MAKIGTRLHRFLFETERQIPEATGELSALLSQLAFAGKRISRVLSSAGLTEALGGLGRGKRPGRAAAEAGRDRERGLPRGLRLRAARPDRRHRGDGVARAPPRKRRVGEVHRLPRPAGRLVQPGRERRCRIDLFGEAAVGAGSGHVGGGPPVARDPGAGRRRILPLRPVDDARLHRRPNGERVHARPGHRRVPPLAPEIRIPSHGPYYGANEGTIRQWDEGPRRFVESLQESDAATGRPYSTRYSGALVSDFHRIILKGGIYLYPATAKSPAGKIRLMYEAAPLALVAEAAGGAASDGSRRILSIFPTANHERTPIYLGSKGDVERLEACVAAARAR